MQNTTKATTASRHSQPHPLGHRRYLTPPPPPPPPDTTTTTTTATIITGITKTRRGTKATSCRGRFSSTSLATSTSLPIATRKIFGFVFL
jgi:hypothetical protein